MPSMEGALPASGIMIMLFMLFSGFIQPKSLISDGWIWMYWISWGIKAVTINEFKSTKYDFPICLDVNCTSSSRFGDLVLSSYGNPTNESWIWWSLLIIIGQFGFFLFLSTFALNYIRWEANPPPPLRAKETDSDEGKEITTVQSVELPYDHVSFACKDIWYTVKLPKGEEINILQGVTGFIEPGTMTALMGASGARKTTLLDVLAGRKNTGKSITLQVLKYSNLSFYS